MPTSTKTALVVAGAACVIAGVFMWALCDLVRQLDEIDYDDFRSYGHYFE